MIGFSMEATASPVPAVALIGVTGYGSHHLNELERLHLAGRISLQAAVVINPGDAQPQLERLAALGTEVLPDSAALFSKYRNRIALCCVPTSIPSHKPLSIEAMECGMNVLVEKPLAASTEDTRAIREAETRTGKFVAVGFQDIYIEQSATLKRMLVSGQLGPLREIRLLCIWPRPTSYYERNHWAGCIRTRDGAPVLDSPLGNAMAHYLNLMLFYAGQRFEESSPATQIQGELWRSQQIENFDTASLEAQTASGVRLVINVTHSALAERGPEIEILCEGGRILIDRMCHTVVARDGSRSDLPPLPHDGKVSQMFDAIVARLHDPAQWICSTSLAECHTAFIEEIFRKLPIRDVPADIIRQGSGNSGGTQFYIESINEKLAAAFEAGSLADLP